MSTRPCSPQTSRRDFVKHSSVLAAGGSLALGLGRARFAHAKGADETIRIGVVGCGGRGNGAAQQMLSTEQGPVKLVAMGDAFEDSVEKAYSALLKSNGEKIDCPKERRFVGLDAYKKVLVCDIRPSDSGDAAGISTGSLRSCGEGRQAYLHGEAGAAVDLRLACDAYWRPWPSRRKRISRSASVCNATTMPDTSKR